MGNVSDLQKINISFKIICSLRKTKYVSFFLCDVCNTYLNEYIVLYTIIVIVISSVIINVIS